MPQRHGSVANYRYGFNGKEKDDEMKGEGNSLNFEYRMHDPRVGRFFAVDPLFKTFPWNSTYSFAENKVIQFKELEGGEILPSEALIFAKAGVYGENPQKIVSGIDKSLTKTINGVKFVCMNPAQALKGIGNFTLGSILSRGAPNYTPAILNPNLVFVDNYLGVSTQATMMAFEEGMVETSDKIINGDLEDRTEIIVDVLTGIAGAKGTDKLIRLSSVIKLESAVSKVATTTRNFDYYGCEFIDDFSKITNVESTPTLISTYPKGLQALKQSLKDLPTMDREAISNALKEHIPSLKYKGGSPDGRFMQWEQIDGDIKVRIDPPDGKTLYDHIHISDSKGNSLDIRLEVKPDDSPDVHIPIKQAEK